MQNNLMAMLYLKTRSTSKGPEGFGTQSLRLYRKTSEMETEFICNSDPWSFFRSLEKAATGFSFTMWIKKGP